MKHIIHQELKFLKTVAGAANLGLMTAPCVISKAVTLLNKAETHQGEVHKRTRVLLETLKSGDIPDKYLCEAVINEIDYSIDQM
jgi:hypothetical protein